MSSAGSSAGTCASPVPLVAASVAAESSPTPASSRTSTYCAWLVSWYSSTSTWRNRRR
ncbi:Uncharacterised protein [Mycobacteroides abscessus]|nr:Uncharacterised protein [Mycobacteroides abscessus]